MVHHMVVLPSLSLRGSLTMKDFLLPMTASRGMSPDQGVASPNRRILRTVSVSQETTEVGRQ